MPQLPSLTDVVSWSPQHLAAEVDDSMVLMSVNQGIYCGLDAIGSDVWRRLAQPMQIGALCDAIASDYRGDRTQITTDVLELLASLREQGLIKVTQAE